MSRHLLPLFLFAYICYSYGLVLDKECPTFTPVDNFNLHALGIGTWHEIARYPNEYENTNCASYEYKPKGKNEVVTKPISSKIPGASFDNIETVFGLAPEAGNKGILLHNITYGDSRATTMLREYVLAVEYDKYYISRECRYDEETKKAYEYAWVVTRSKNYGSDVKTAIDNFLRTSKDIDASKLIWLDLQDKSC